MRGLRRRRADTAARFSPTRRAPLSFTRPIASSLALGEPLGVREAAALGLTLGGIALAVRG